MGVFVNTADVVGDEVLAASIIDKSVTEISDNITRTIGEGVFLTCNKLLKAEFLEATKVGNSAFESAISLTEIKLPKAEDLGGSAFSKCGNIALCDLPAAKQVTFGTFSNCSKLSLILRNENTVCVAVGDALSNSAIANGTGYIYVPRALVDTYKAATNWSKYAAQVRALEDYTVDGTIAGELDPTKI